MSSPPAPPELSQRLALILEALRRTIAARAGRDRTLSAIVLLAWPYLHRLAARFDALARRARAGGKVATPRPRPASLAPRLLPAGLPLRLPRGFAWLIRLAPDAAALGGQVRHLLADPEFSALLTAAPQAGRILRPLCRMLGILPGPGLPAALFRPPAPPRSAAPPLPASPPPVEPSPTPSPVPDWPTAPGPSSKRRARPRLPRFRAVPA